MPMSFDADWRHAAEREYLEKRNKMLAQLEESAVKMKRLHAEINDIAKSIAELDQAARTFGLRAAEEAQQPEKPKVVTPPPTPSKPAPQFKDVALDILREAYPRTCKAADIQEQAEERVGREFHPKTAGMTLYRLSLEGLVERVGRAEWQYVPQEDEGSEAEAPEPSMFP